MSLGCGTLASPSEFRTGNLAAASGDGRLHTLPRNPAHAKLTAKDVQALWKAEQPSGPTRAWGSSRASRFGGEERLDGSAEFWQRGEYWNVDSNISIWGEHEVRRNAAEGSIDVHRHDQIRRIVLPPQPGSPKQEPRICLSGVITADSGFMEAWGFDLGLRDRHGNPAPLWRPAARGEMFRARRSYERNVPRMAERSRTLRMSVSALGESSATASTPVLFEDIGGEVEDMFEPPANQVLTQGRTHASRSCRFWDAWGHTCKREAARLSRSIHTPSAASHPHGYPTKDNIEVNPASVYTLKYRKFGEDGLRKHSTASEKSMSLVNTGASSDFGQTLRLN